ncbi:MAG: NADH-quinone oxidoreductase subunit K [Candidatus Methanospirareceae archaeon]
MQIDLITVSAIYITSFALLLIGYAVALSSKDLVRLLISLELMFGAVFISVLPLFSSISNTAFGITIVGVFTSSCELLVLITAIIIFDRKKKNIYTSSVTIGGDKL